MSRIAVWALLSLGYLGYWGIAYGFASNAIDQFAGPVWYGGVALATHWMMNYK